jgi:hypothetical protein
MNLPLKDAIEIFKIVTGALGLFLILFGIHWAAILVGIAMGVISYAIPKNYLH